MSYFRAFAAVAALASVQQVSGWEIDLPSCLSPFRPFTYSGCYTNPDGAINALVYRSNIPTTGMTIETCVQDCKGQGYRYAGLKYYGVCFCGDSVSGTLVDEAQCNTPCDGNKTETCGGDHAISVFSDPTFPAVDDTTIVNYANAGCYSDNSDLGRALAHRADALPSATMTPALCLASCKAGGYPFAGLEFGGECYCGPVIGNFSESLDSSSCSMPCNGDASQTCGGSGALNLYVAKELQSLEPCGYVPPPPVSSSTTSTKPSTTPYSSSVPTISVPSSSVPTISVPSSSIPTISVPSSSVPPSSVPSSSVPTTTRQTTAPTTTPSSTSAPASSTTTPPVTTKPPTSSPPATTALCTTTVTVPSTCEYGCGKWCADALPEWNDSNSCTNGWSRCKLQIADCFRNAGWPDAMNCFDFSQWCGGISSYCGAAKPGSKCSKSDCFGKNPPKNNKPPTVTTSVYACPVTTGKPTTSSVPTTSTTVTCPIPVVTNICKQPSSWKYNYGPGNPVGGIELPVVTCNDIKADYDSGNQFKLYKNKDSSTCKSYKRPQCGNACADACRAQYDQCQATYVAGCKANNGGTGGGRFWARDNAEARSIQERTWRFGWTDNSDAANNKCYTQYVDCLDENRNVDISNKCGAFGKGW